MQPIGVKSDVRFASSENVQILLYGMLFIIVFASLFLFLGFGFGFLEFTWSYYHKFYIAFALTYIWLNYILLFVNDYSDIEYPEYEGELISVIVPCYNEDPELLKRCIQSIVNAKGNKEVILVNDGSTNGVQNNIEDVGKEFDITALTYSNNKGKRYAIHYGAQRVSNDSKFIVTTDSDTVFDRDAIINLVRPLKNNKIGATSGDVKLLNEKENLLTRMIGAYYWSALHIHRRAESSMGMVNCCSGALAAYKTKIFKSVIDSFLNQTFLGEKCTYGEDRHLTNLVMKHGYDVVFVPSSTVYTCTPSTMYAFLKQQQRWRRGFVRESLFSLSFMWKVKPFLFLEILIWNLLLYFSSLAIVLFIFASIILNPSFFFLVLLPSWLVLMIVRHVPMLFHARDKLFGLFLFTLFSHFVLYWQGFYALFTLRNSKWATR